MTKIISGRSSTSVLLTPSKSFPSGSGKGAIAAAEFIIVREAGMYDMNDLIALNA